MANKTGKSAGKYSPEQRAKALQAFMKFRAAGSSINKAAHKAAKLIGASGMSVLGWLAREGEPADVAAPALPAAVVHAIAHPAVDPRNRFSPEVKQKAIALYKEKRAEYRTDAEALIAVGKIVGASKDSVWKWAHGYIDRRPGPEGRAKLAAKQAAAPPPATNGHAHPAPAPSLLLLQRSNRMLRQALVAVLMADQAVAAAPQDE